MIFFGKFLRSKGLSFSIRLKLRSLVKDIGCNHIAPFTLFYPFEQQPIKLCLTMKQPSVVVDSSSIKQKRFKATVETRYRLIYGITYPWLLTILTIILGFHVYEKDP